MTDTAAEGEADEAAGKAGRGRKRSSPWLFLRELLVVLLIAVTVSFLLKTFIVRAFYIPSTSMESTLQINDRILVDQLSPHWNDYERGEIVVFSDPGGWLPFRPSGPARPPLVEGFDRLLTFIGLSTADSEDHLVKRVIGLPGDHVVCCNALGQITINGVPVDESSFIKLPSGDDRASQIPFDVTVPEGAFWVLGDNRHRSQDSRAHQEGPGGGFVPLDSVVGRAFVMIWPLTRFGDVGAHTEVYLGVPDPR